MKRFLSYSSSLPLSALSSRNKVEDLANLGYKKVRWLSKVLVIHLPTLGTTTSTQFISFFPCIISQHFRSDLADIERIFCSKINELVG